MLATQVRDDKDMEPMTFRVGEQGNAIHNPMYDKNLHFDDGERVSEDCQSLVGPRDNGTSPSEQDVVPAKASKAHRANRFRLQLGAALALVAVASIIVAVVVTQTGINGGGDPAGGSVNGNNPLGQFSGSSELPSRTPTASYPTDSPSLTPPIILLPGSYQVLPSGRVMLASAGPNQLLRLVMVDRNSGDKALCGRSYDSLAWEAAPPENFLFVCGETFEGGIYRTASAPATSMLCSAHIPSSLTSVYEFRLEVFDFSNDIVSSRSAASRWMQKFTFGASRGDLERFFRAFNGNVSHWLTDQLEKPATSLRGFFREQANVPYPDSYSVDYVGTTRSPCEKDSRWHRQAFSNDDLHKQIQITPSIPGHFLLSINGIFRTVVPAAEWSSIAENQNHTICSMEHWVNGQLKLGSSCQFIVTNPPIMSASTFAPPADRMVVTVDSAAIFGYALNWSTAGVLLPDPNLTAGISTSCSINTPFAGPLFLTVTESGEIFKLSKRLQLINNTLNDPATDNTPAIKFSECPASPRTFLNENNCAIGTSTCAPTRYSSAIFQLNASVLLRFYELGGRHIHAIQGLRWYADEDPSPCAGATSRWIRRGSNASACVGQVDSEATSIIAMRLDQHEHAPLIQDVVIANPNCTHVPAGVSILVGDYCWENTHPNENSVYDFTDFTWSHPGNTAARDNDNPNPIAKWAWYRLFYLQFPGHHPMSRWIDRVRSLGSGIKYVGKLNASVDFVDLHAGLQNDIMAETLGSVRIESEVGNFMACGSPGEMETIPSNGATVIFDQGLVGAGHLYRIKDISPRVMNFKQTKGRTNIWRNVVLNSSDQLRQRVAWAFSQIFVVNAIGNIGQEPYLNFYDIFVRNAFGNYRNILREISYSPMMGKMLSYIDSASITQSGSHPDENFAREVMQLFSMGLFQLHDNGTVIKDRDGNTQTTYTQDNIVTFARAWTGLGLQLKRGNLERDGDVSNYVDPMKLKILLRDSEPKGDLYGGYIGDKYPLCADLPSKSYLRIGAKYRYLGAIPFPEKFSEPADYKELDSNYVRFVLPSNSSLYRFLCRPVNRTCNFPSVVTLLENLQCVGVECDVDTARVIKLAGAGRKPDGTIYDVYYEHIRQPCVFESFPETTTVVANQEGLRLKRNWEVFCTDPRTRVAGTACCVSNTTNQASCGPFEYSNERLPQALASQRCAAAGKELCTDVERWRLRSSSGCERSNSYFWINEGRECNVKVQIHNSGDINIVHEIPLFSGNLYDEGTKYDVDNTRRFLVTWENNSIPSQSNCPSDCEVLTTSCLCPTITVREAVFTGNIRMPTRQEILANLMTGALEPDAFDNGTYLLCTTAFCTSQSDVSVYVPSGLNVDSTGLNVDVVFQVFEDQVEPKRRFLKNVVSIVMVGAEGNFRFRNPVSFYTPGQRDGLGAVRDAEAEIEAVLDHYFYHPSTPPFMARALIQKLVTSNPSPRYVESVATAFKRGTYHSFGSGIRGDLTAIVASIVLDSEAQSTILDRDPTHGALREPLLKTVSLERSLELVIQPEVRLIFEKNLIDQGPFGAPSVFNFFQTDFQPRGAVENARLVEPVAQILTAPNIMGYLSTVFGLTKFGLTSCFGGAGPAESRDDYWTCRQQQELNEEFDDTNNALYYLSLNVSDALGTDSPSEIVAELDLLLTGSRSSNDTIEIVETLFNTTLESTGNITAATKMAKAAFAVAPEFQVTGGSLQQTSLRVESNETVSGQGRPYKAIIYVWLGGGADSYNMLVPHSGCPENDLYEQYSTVRTNIALAKGSLLQINASTAQPCAKFGMHPSMTNIHRMYNNGDALWFANTGPLVEPLADKEAFKSARQSEKPIQLFAHNIQSKISQTLRPRSTTKNDGVLGRLAEKVKRNGYSTGLYSIKGNDATVLQPIGNLNYDILSNSGVSQLDQRHDALKEIADIMNQRHLVAPHADTWSHLMRQGINRTDVLAEVLDAVELSDAWDATSKFSGQLRTVAKLIKASTDGNGTLRTERDVFFVSLGGWDVHGDAVETTEALLNYLDSALGELEEELRAQGVWDNVTLIQASEFGRTLTSNGAGSDHAWAGNYFMAGGPVRGGRILGQYPSALTEDHPNILGRGRILPTTSWEQIFNAVAEWFGSPQEDMNFVVPMIRNFPSDTLFHASDIFHSD